VLVDRGRITKQISLFFDAREQTQTEMFSVVAEMSLSITAASGLLATCSVLAVQQHRKSYRQFILYLVDPVTRNTEINSGSGNETSTLWIFGSVTMPPDDICIWRIVRTQNANYISTASG